MKRREFLKSSLAAGAAVATPSLVTAKQESDGLLRVTGKHGNAVVDFHNRKIWIDGLIEGDQLYRQINDNIDLIAPTALTPMQGVSGLEPNKKMYRFRPDWWISDPRQVIDCQIEGVLEITVLAVDIQKLAEIYVNGMAIHSDWTIDVVYHESRDNNLCVRPMVNYPEGSNIRLIGVSEDRASTFDVTIPKNKQVVAALTV